MPSTQEGTTTQESGVRRKGEEHYPGAIFWKPTKKCVSENNADRTKHKYFHQFQTTGKDCLPSFSTPQQPKCITKV
jgi:hypothetical protein